ncbi:MAG: GIY-YIG nuclease family protein [Opitutaceae bacterium]|nr:GIY-YIG nuclease family protein [Opitutaceae bacterium]
MSLEFVYVLRLKNGGFYIGSTRAPLQRISAHFHGQGARATREHRPVAIEAIYSIPEDDRGPPSTRERLETHLANRYVEKYGLTRVRGGDHCSAWNETPSADAQRLLAWGRRFLRDKADRSWLRSVRKVGLGTSHVTSD